MSHSGTDLESLGHFIRERRKILSLTQTQLGIRLGWVQERISLLENGRYGTPSLPALALLADSLETPLADLLTAAGFRTPEAGAQDGNGRTASNDTPLQYTLQTLLTIDADSVEGALKQASKFMAQAIGAEKIDAFMLDASSQSLVALGTSKTPMGELQHRVGLHRYPIANRGRVVNVYETGTCFYTGDAQRDAEIPIGVKQTLGVQSVLAVPMVVGDSIQGVLVAESTKRNRFSLEDQAFFAAAACWVGMIAQHAQNVEAMRATVAEDVRRTTTDMLIATLARGLGFHLTSLQDHVDGLARRLDQPGEQRNVTAVQEASGDLTLLWRLVCRLRDVARLNDGLLVPTLDPINLAEVVRDMVERTSTVWPALNVQGEHTLEVCGDRVRLQAILLDLLDNAIQYSEKGTAIRLSAVTERRTDGSWAVVTVSDHGTGIDPELLPRLFEQYTMGRQSVGLGLSLYLAGGIIALHRGTIAIESTLGIGTTVTLALPCIQPQ